MGPFKNSRRAVQYIWAVLQGSFYVNVVGPELSARTLRTTSSSTGVLANHGLPSLLFKKIYDPKSSWAVYFFNCLCSPANLDKQFLTHYIQLFLNWVLFCFDMDCTPLKPGKKGYVCPGHQNGKAKKMRSRGLLCCGIQARSTQHSSQASHTIANT